MSFALAPATAPVDAVAADGRRGGIPVNQTNRAGAVHGMAAAMGFGGGRSRIQVSEDLPDHLGILDTRDDPHRPTAGRAGPDINAEDPL